VKKDWERKEGCRDNARMMSGDRSERERYQALSGLFDSALCLLLPTY